MESELLSTGGDAALMKAFELGAGQGMKVYNTEASQYLLSPKDWTLHKIYEKPKANPDLFKGAVKFTSVDSLLRYTKVFFPDIMPSALAYGSKCGIEVIFDDHGTLPGNCQFSADFAPQHTTEWDTWMKKNDVAMSQTDFANFLEDNAEDVESPDGATLLEIVTTLQSTSETHFKSAVDLSNGSRQLRWEGVEEAKAGKDGQLSVPRFFIINVQIYQDMELRATKLKAMLRYRKQANGSVHFSYKLIRPEKAVEKAMAIFHEEFQAGCEVPFFTV